MKKKKYAIRPVNKIFISGLLSVLVLFAGISVYSSYSAQRDSLMRQCDFVLQDIFDLYYEKVYSFSDVYLPIFQTDTGEEAFRSYFEREGDQALNARPRSELVELLQDMIKQDKDIEFIALYNPDARKNYYLSAGGNRLMLFNEENLFEDNESSNRMQLLGRYIWKKDSDQEVNTFVIKGGAVAENKSGSLLVGYNASIFDSLLRDDRAELPAAFVLWNEKGVLYDSKQIRYGEEFPENWLEEVTSFGQGPDGTHWYTGMLKNEGRIFKAAYLLPWRQVIRSSNQAALSILLILFFFACFSLALYMYATRQIFYKVERIHQGLSAIGENRLEYRLQVTNVSDEFDQIASNINTMAERLQESIENEYQMRMRQRWSELTQIQARFNPHFLYNTLEVIRGKLFQNGDIENADYIEKLSRIFRSLTDAEPVITIRVEISFCSLYLALLQLRYHDAVDITYEVAAEIQQCGILAHLIQPAIENYFMHAISENADYHEMEIICERTKENWVRFIITDNGTGMPPEKMEELNQKLKNPVMEGKGYGLMSIAKRIRMFYGEAYGVVLEQNQPCGVRVIITIPRMDKEEHLRKLGIVDN